MSFDRPALLGLALLLPGLLALAIAGYAARRRRVARTVADPRLLDRIGGPGLSEFPLSRLLLVCGASAALGMAAAGPRWGSRSVEQQSSVLDVVLAVDISKSMFAEDLSPSRLERERIFLRRLVRELAGDRVGLVVFAGRAYVLSPLTTDHGAINLYLDALDPEIVSQGGSSLAAALAQAADLARGAEEVGGDRAVVLISDGEALEEQQAVRAAADRAARAGVTVFTVGVGTTAGAPVPERDAAGETVGYKRDFDGSVVISKLNENLLEEIAGTTRGRYIRLDAVDAVGRLAGGLRDLERRPGTGARSEAPERFAWFVALALLLLGLDAWKHRRRKGSPAIAVRRRAAPARAAAAVLLLVLLGFGIGDFERGNRLYRAGQYAEAVVAYEEALRDGDARPELLYNLGTALLRLGRFEEAQRALDASLNAVEPDLRRRAHYNLGNRFLVDARGRQDATQQVQLLDAAVEAYKRSLRLDPADADAKWNLEMALRERDEAEQQQQQQDPQPSEEQEDEEQPQPQQGSGGTSGEDTDQPLPSDRAQMSEEQADRILSAVEQDERQLTREKLRKGDRRTRVARDW